MDKPKVGMFVYKPYSANKPGKIIKILNKAKNSSISIAGISMPVKHDCEVKWLDGKITTENSFNLSDFNALIADHQKKIQTHQAKLPLLQAL